MQAARLYEFGQPLRIEDVPSRAPGVDEVVVRLAYASVNPLDVRFCGGGAGKPELPFVPGCDGVGETDSGWVAVQGAGVGTQRPGTFAEEVVTPAAAVVPLPAGLEPRVAAALGVAGMTAAYLVREVAAITAADRVLVLGVTGSVATVARQIAVATGATVSGHSTRPMESGEVVVADATGLRDAVRSLRPTVVLDGLGGEYTAEAIRSLSTGGRLALYGVAAAARAEIDLATVYRRAITISGVATRELTPERTSAALADCLALAAEGKVSPVIAGEVALSDVNDGLGRLRGRGVTGKVLISVR